MTDRDLLVLLVATGVATGLSGGLVLLYVWVVARRIRRHLHALLKGPDSARHIAECVAMQAAINETESR